VPAAVAVPAETDAASDAAAGFAAEQPGQLSTQQYREKYSMWVLPGDAPAPFQTFEQASLPPQLLKAVSVIVQCCRLCVPLSLHTTLGVLRSRLGVFRVHNRMRLWFACGLSLYLYR
jgi:hypothetical protein